MWLLYVCVCVWLWLCLWRLQTLFPLLNVSGTGLLTKAELVCGFLLIIDGSIEQKLEMLFHSFDKERRGRLERPAVLRLVTTLLTMAYDRGMSNEEVSPSSLQPQYVWVGLLLRRAVPVPMVVAAAAAVAVTVAVSW